MVPNRPLEVINPANDSFFAVTDLGGIKERSKRCESELEAVQSLPLQAIEVLIERL